MTSIEQFVGVALVQCSQGEENDIVDHVRIRDVVHKRRKRLDSIGSDVVELGNKLLRRLVGNGSGGQRKGFVGKEVAIVSSREL